MSMEHDRQAMSYLIANEGWKLVETFIDQRIEDAKSRLLTCKTFEEVLDIRVKINTFNSIFKFINDTLEIKEE